MGSLTRIPLSRVPVKPVKDVRWLFAASIGPLRILYCVHYNFGLVDATQWPIPLECDLRSIEFGAPTEYLILFILHRYILCAHVNCWETPTGK